MSITENGDQNAMQTVYDATKGENPSKLVGGKELHIGFTTGSCATSAACAATEMLFTGTPVTQSAILLPNGARLLQEIVDIQMERDFVSCAVVKDGGDDPDVTSGLKVFARVSRIGSTSSGAADTDTFLDGMKRASNGHAAHAESVRSTGADAAGTDTVNAQKEAGGADMTDTDAVPADETEHVKESPALTSVAHPGIYLRAGKGIGIVTKNGLAVPIGEPAINPVPRAMLFENVDAVLRRCGDGAEIEILLSIENGEDAAKHTFNPMLGIRGGLSVLGTTGIVDPMSEKALIDTIKVDTDSKFAADPDLVLLTPGNYAKKFCAEKLSIDPDNTVEISNYIGDSLDYVRYKGFHKVLLIGHTGKLVKIAAGLMNTHSSQGDARMEVIAAHSAMYGASRETVQRIMECVTTEEAFNIIRDGSYFEDVKQSILRKVLFHLNRRLRGEVRAEVILFNLRGEDIIASADADAFVRQKRAHASKTRSEGQA